MKILPFIFLSACIYFVLILAEEIDPPFYQSLCDPSKNNGECSNNFDCRCSTVVPTEERICTLPIKCSSATPCNSNKCNRTDSICVIDHRCSGRRLCYPVSLNSPDNCPPLATNDNLNNEH